MNVLSDLKPEESARIVSLENLGQLRGRLIDLGIIPGTIVKVKRRAPFGDPIEINVRGYNLGIRKNDADKINIECMERNESCLLLKEEVGNEPKKKIKT